MNGGVRNEEETGKKKSRTTDALGNLRIDVPGLGSVASGRLCEGDAASCISLQEIQENKKSRKVQTLQLFQIGDIKYQ